MSTETYPDTFKQWLIDNIGSDPDYRTALDDLASHGADTGWPGLIYTSDCAALFDQYQDEIWTLVIDTADEYGLKPMDFIGSFNRADMAEGSFDSFKNLLVWFAAETYAREVADEDEHERNFGMPGYVDEEEEVTA